MVSRFPHSHLGLQSHLQTYPNACHFDRPAGVEKPLHFADAHIAEEARSTLYYYLAEATVILKMLYAAD